MEMCTDYDAKDLGDAHQALNLLSKSDDLT